MGRANGLHIGARRLGGPFKACLIGWRHTTRVWVYEARKRQLRSLAIAGSNLTGVDTGREAGASARYPHDDCDNGRRMTTGRTAAPRETGVRGCAKSRFGGFLHTPPKRCIKRVDQAFGVSEYLRGHETGILRRLLRRGGADVPQSGGVRPNRRKFCHAHVERRVP